MSLSCAGGAGEAALLKIFDQFRTGIIGSAVTYFSVIAAVLALWPAFAEPVASAASLNDLKQQLAQCEISAANVYPRYIDAPNGQPLAFIQLCMKSAGYDWVGFPTDPECGQTHIMMGMPDLDDSGAHCFAPMKR